jgi:hypothetical protein
VWPGSVENPFYSNPVFSSQSAGSVDLPEISLASHRATLLDFMAFSYGPARALAYDRRRGFRAWVDCDRRYGRNFCLARCNAHKHVQASPIMPLYSANTVDAPLQERGKSRKKINRVFLMIGNPLKMDIRLSRATCASTQKFVDLTIACATGLFVAKLVPPLGAGQNLLPIRTRAMVVSPTHKRTEGRAPVWGSEFTSKRRRTTGGIQQKSLLG